MNTDASTKPLFFMPWKVAVAGALILAATNASNNWVEAFAKMAQISDRMQREQTHSRDRFPNIHFRGENSVNQYVTLFSSSPETEYAEGGPVSDLFPPKVLDGAAFNLFGIGRKADEEPNGAFQPPKDSMTGTVVVITGSNNGLGFESAKRLALAGATVVATAQTQEKAMNAVRAIRDYCRGIPSPKNVRMQKGSFLNPNPVVRGIALDMEDFSSIRTFPERYRQSMLSLSKIRDRDEEGPGEPPPSTTTKTINVLMNNAISGATERTLTVDGIERIFQSTYLGHFLLTARLFEEGLLSGSGCTVINVSSVAHRAAEVKWNEDDETQNAKNEYGFNFDNINSDIGYSFQTYNQAKLANIMFTKELQRRADLATALSHEKSYLTSVSLEPGGVATDIWRTSLGFDPRTFEQRRANGEEIDQPADQTWKDKLTSSFFYRAWTQVERGANAQVWLAYASSNGSDIDLIGGQHYSEYRKPIPALGFAYQQHSNQKLWEVSEALADIRFDLETSAHRQPQNKCPADAA